MKTMKSVMLQVALLGLVAFSDAAQAWTITNKITAFTTYSTQSGNYYLVTIGGVKMHTATQHMGELMREAFLRKLTITAEYDPPVPYYTAKVNTVTIQSIDVP
jgi:hypothetical protein